MFSRQTSQCSIRNELWVFDEQKENQCSCHVEDKGKGLGMDLDGPTKVLRRGGLVFSEASESSAGLSLLLASISELEVALRSPPVSTFSAPLKTTQ